MCSHYATKTKNPVDLLAMAAFYLFVLQTHFFFFNMLKITEISKKYSLRRNIKLLLARLNCLNSIFETIYVNF